MREFFKRTGRVLALLAATAIAAPVAHAQMFANSKLYVGTLNCRESGSIGLIFGSTKELHCLLIRPNGTTESYSGKINRFGIDIGFTKPIHVAWHVYSVAENAPEGILAGQYVGGQQSVAVGATAGGNGLVGSGNNIILTSVVVQAEKSGLNLADGIAEMTLNRIGS
jgi:hypothetical protein